ncbi:hypothetical protein, partial [Mycobacterium tuberculosis]|uniref:hypothetical protein n=1 Tax=Mycobacterium tuberculosis TaxID=1773 RepID=UPI0034CE75CE
FFSVFLISFPSFPPSFSPPLYFLLFFLWQPFATCLYPPALASSPSLFLPAATFSPTLAPPPGPASSPLMLFAPSVQLDHEPSVCVLASRLIVLVHLKLP